MRSEPISFTRLFANPMGGCVRVVVREKERRSRVRVLSVICTGVEEIYIGIRVEGDSSASFRINALTIKNPA